MAKEVTRGEQLARPFFRLHPHRVARFLSHLLNPALLALLVFGVQAHVLGDWRGGAVAIGTFSVVPGLLLWHLVRSGYLDKAYTDDRNKRGTLLLLGACCYALGGAALYSISVPPLMLITAASCVINTLLVWWINRSYKISIHAAGVGGATYILLISVGSAAWPFLLSWPAVAWARLYLRAHTPMQLGAGGALGAGSTALLYSAFML